MSNNFNHFQQDYSRLVDAFEQKQAHAPDLAREMAAKYPDSRQMLNLAAVVFASKDGKENKEEALSIWLKIKPEDREEQINTNIAKIYNELEQYENAIEFLKQAVHINPEYESIYIQLALAYDRLKNYPQARESYHQLLKRQPNNTSVIYNIGTTFAKQNDFFQAIPYYRRTLDINPMMSSPLSNLLFSLQYLPNQDYATLVREMRQRADVFSQLMKQKLKLSPAKLPSESQKVLHIGLLSGDLRLHPVGLFIEGLLFESFEQAVEWSAYYNNDKNDALSERIKPLFKHWRQIEKMSDKEVCEQIRADGIDILIDLSGHTDKNRAEVMAVQVAPVQVEWLGYFATTGFPTVQAIIADPYCVPPEEEKFYCEKVYRMPHTRLCMVPPERETLIEPNHLPALEKGHFTFGCFQNINKINDEVLKLWAEISQQRPNASWRFQLGNSSVNDENVVRLHEKMRELNWQGDIQFVEKTLRGDYMKAYHQIDLILDVFPFPGGTTTAEALWMGVPTITWVHQGMVGRQGEQILSAAGVPQWIAYSREEYLEKALYWSHPDHFAELNQFRTTFRKNARYQPLYDFKQFAIDWHRLIRQIWQDACAAQGETIQTASTINTNIPNKISQLNQEEIRKIIEAHPQYLAAFSFWRQNKLTESLERINDLLRQFPHADALLNFKAVLLAQSGQTADAIEVWEQISDYQTNVDILGNLGVAYQRIHNLSKSRLILEKAHEIAPQNSSILVNLGITLEKLLEMSAAMDCYQRACDADPNNQTAKNNLERIQHNLAREENNQPWMNEYVEIVRKRYEDRPFALAAIHALSERYPDARKVSIFKADMLADDGQFDESLAVYDSLPDKNAQMLARMGVIHWQNKNKEQAREYLSQALALEADNTTALIYLAIIEQDAEEFDKAIATLEKLLQQDDKNQMALLSLANIYANQGNFPRAFEYYHRLLNLNPDHLHAQGLAAFFRNYMMPHEPEKRAEEVKKIGKLYAKFNKIEPASKPENPEKPLRIGLVSADLNNHVVGFFVESLLSGKAIKQYQWVAYANTEKVSALTHRIQPLFEKWHEISKWATDKVVEQIRSDGIDILIDLSGYTAGHRLDVFATQAAPLQLTWLGYFATTGIPAIQGIIADPYCVPVGEEHLFSEKVYRMPHTRLCMTAPGTSGAGRIVQGKIGGHSTAQIAASNEPNYQIDILPNPSLKNGYITFGCYQNLLKMNDEVLKTWAKIAQQLPNARFHFQTSRFKEGSKDRAQFEQKLQDLGFNLDNVSMEGTIAREKYLAGYNDVDIVLDTFPYNGGTTTAEALWMGKPTLSLALAGMISRQGEQMLSAAGYAHWVCRSEEEYIAQAVKWGNPANFAKLNEEHMQMREKVLASPLFNTEQFATDWCNLIREIWHDACENSDR